MIDNLGYDVLLGKGVCRHIDDIYDETLKKCGYDAYSTTCCLKENNKFGEYDANHQISIVNSYNGITYHDVTNGDILDEYDSDKSYVTTLANDYYILLMPEESSPLSRYITTINDYDEIDEINSWYESDVLDNLVLTR